MAEQATKEPTMEEILSSIRRIISEDGSPADEVSEEASSAGDGGDFLGLGVDFEEVANEHVEVAQGEHLLSVDELLDSETEFTDFEELSEANASGAANETDFGLGEPSLDEVFDDATLDKNVAEIEANVFAGERPAPVPAPEKHIAEPAIAKVAAPAPVAEAAAPAARAAVQKTAPEARPAAPNPTLGAMASAGASGNPIENMVSEMMRPMIKEWIDTNLPGIVERKVEAEIQQVANKVVAALRND